MYQHVPHLFCVFKTIFKQHLGDHHHDKDLHNHYVGGDHPHLLGFTALHSVKIIDIDNNIHQHTVSIGLLRLFIFIFDRCGNKHGVEDLHFPTVKHVDLTNRR